MTACGFDAAVVHAGRTHDYFQDDQGPRFEPNPNLTQWVARDFIGQEDCLALANGEPAKLFCYRPVDYWHAEAPVPEGLATDLEVVTYASLNAMHTALTQHIGQSANCCHISPEPANDGANWATGSTNPDALINRLHYQRAFKSDFEIAAMREASRLGVLGHQAAAAEFANGGSEFSIHMAFLAASGQTDLDVPYGNIVAVNQNASVLHYQHKDRHVGEPLLSLLIDAGARSHGYASDITRTYIHPDTAKLGSHTMAGATFAELIKRMDSLQQTLVSQVRSNLDYLALHTTFHRHLAQLLEESQLISLSADEIFSKGITEVFCPHGLGHLLGLQVHDVGGQQINADGEQKAPPENYPSLRMTRPIEERMVFTIEPGLYFIDSLLAKLKAHGDCVNWDLINALRPFGGIRIEDNVLVTESGCENLTRAAFATL